MKILLFGKNGQIGREFPGQLSKVYDLLIFGRSEVDLQDVESLQQTLHKYHPNIILNAAAYTDVDVAESDLKSAYSINAQAIEIIAKYAKQSNALLIYYSTDFVFDGEKTSPYTESDSPNPLNVYGHSKLAGEQYILSNYCNSLIFRISWVFSSYKKNFITQILNLAKTKSELFVVDDQIGAPTSARFVAKITAQALGKYQKKEMESGIYNLSPSGEVSRYEFACYIVKRAHMLGLPLMLQESKIYPVSSETYPSPAKRPKNSRLNTEKLSGALNMTFSHWTEDVDITIDEYIKVSQ